MKDRSELRLKVWEKVLTLAFEAAEGWAMSGRLGLMRHSVRERK
jgi:hypothetical protein